jgi:peptidoglycan/LPS O-acetylase OafA/YrhL
MAHAEHRSDFGYRPALDGLRAVSVLAVFAYHLDYEWAAGGFLGVDAFFVLSGYLITSLLLVEHGRAGTISLRAFWTRRAKRLLPAVLALLIGVALYAAFVASTDQLGTLRGDSLATLFYVANWRFIAAGTSYFELWSEASPLRHMWSLAIEEQFYLMWPLLVLGALRLGRGRPRVLAAGAFVGAIGSVALMAALYDPADPSEAYFSTFTRAHTLLVGALLAVLLHRREISSPVLARGLQGAGAVAAGALLVCFWRVQDTGEIFYKGLSPAFAVLVAVVIAAAVQTGSSPLREALSPAPLRWVGRVSYGLYLWHWPMIVWLTRGRTQLDGLALDAVRVAAAFAITALSYYLLEQRVRFATVRYRQVAVAVPAAMAVTALALLGTTTGATTSRFAVAPEFTVPTIAPASPTTGAPGTTGPGGTAGTGTTAPGTTAPGGDRRIGTIAMVGDSVSTTIADGLQPAADAQGMRFVSVAFPGCGVAAGFMLTDDGRPFEWSEQCFENIPRLHSELVATHDPDVVVWHSTWEMADRRGDDGEHLRYGTPEHDAALRADIEAAVDRLTAGGARVVFLLVVPRAESDTVPADGEDAAARVEHFNAILRSVAEDRPDDVAYVDLNPIVCPGGVPCPTEVDGIRLRPDGGHFVEASTHWLAARLLPQILAAA